MKIFLVIVWISNFGSGFDFDARGPFPTVQLCEDARHKARSEMPLQLFSREIGMTCVKVEAPRRRL